MARTTFVFRQVEEESPLGMLCIATKPAKDQDHAEAARLARKQALTGARGSGAIPDIDEPDVAIRLAKENALFVDGLQRLYG